MTTGFEVMWNAMFVSGSIMVLVYLGMRIYFKSKEGSLNEPENTS